jgi:UDP-N-acetylmuramoyl-tripeptide--D-alanyl-D-alanine ligase
MHADADFRASAVTQTAGADGIELSFTMHCPAGELPLRLPMAGRHNVINALAAAAATMAAGAALPAVVAGLAAARNVAGRLRHVAGRQGIDLYDDSYNANPASVRAAIAFLEALPGERWLVLGDMAELGPDSPAMHREIGEIARLSGVARLYCTGPQSRATAEAFGVNAQWCETAAELAAALLPALHAGVTVLVKGSRSAGMERVVEALAREGAAPAGWGH